MTRYFPIEAYKERATPEKGDAKKLSPVRLYKPANDVPTRIPR